MSKELIDQVSPSPWDLDRGSWHGEMISVDGCPATDFTREDVARVCQWATTDSTDWDGNTAGVLQLVDGRFVAWEADWGPTGDGFCEDAYGGAADLVFATTEDAAMSRMTEQGRDLLRTNAVL